MKKIVAILVLTGGACFAQTSVTLTVTAAQINRSVTAVLGGTQKWDSASSYTGRVVVLEGYTNRTITLEAYTNRITALEPYTNRITALEPYTNRITALEHYTNRITALEPYTNRVVALEPYTNRITALEPYTNRITALEPYTNRVSNLEGYTNAIVANTNGFTPAEYTTETSVVFPNAFRICFGRTGNIAGSGATSNIVFSPAFTTLPVILSTCASPISQVGVYGTHYNETTNGFTLINEGTPVAYFTWIAIGK